MVAEAGGLHRHTMRKITSVTGMQRLALRWQRQGVAVGFVPTMGYLHAGHLSLVKEARRRVGRTGRVVVSIYVNPTQFAPTEDLAKYPRDLACDTRLCREAGADVLFVPADAEMYPQTEPAFSTYVVEERLSQSMEGSSRPTHFRGVTTVVAKLFNLVQPRVAVFGAKDWQQAAVIQQMVKDLNMPLKVVVAPTVREPDGLAMSSRNKYLNPEERQNALVLQRAIQETIRAVKASAKGVPAARLRNRVAELVQATPGARLDYVDFFHPVTLEAVGRVQPGAQIALAVFMGRTRLIDNARIA